jgi:hypothetical protein
MALIPAFVLATPRSGSTLVQRVLTTYQGVASAAEPWLLLPPLLVLLERPPLTDAWHRQVGTAIRDYVRELPGEEQDYLGAVRRFALELYERATPGGTRIFLDKTPPYHYIVPQLMRAFPDGRFIFLWRNPLSVLTSTVETFCGGRWRAERHRGDLFDGVVHLADAYTRFADRAVCARYEDLVSGDEAPWRRITAHLGFEFDPKSLSSFAQVRFSGRMGDPTGTTRYAALSRDSVDRWKTHITNPARREWCMRYLRWLGRERLAIMGYDLDALLSELRGITVGSRDLVADLRDMGEGVARELVRGRLRDDGLTRASLALLRAT